MKKVKLAKKSIDKLFNNADSAYQKGDSSHANRYVEIARAISTRNRVKMDKEQKLRFCKNCHTFLGATNSRVRINNGKIVQLCKECKHFRRIPY